MSKVAVIRMKGRFSLAPSIEKTLDSLRLNRLYSCAVVELSPSTKGMLQEAKDAIAYGPISKESLSMLLRKRGKTVEGKKLSDSKKQEETEKMASEILASEKPLKEFGVHSVFFLSPPKGGMGSKKEPAPFGPLGKNPRISELIARMA